MVNEGKLQISLALIRISTAAFFLVWSIEKIIYPEVTQRILKKFYFLSISSSMSVGIGIIQTLITLIFLVGLFKTFSYGALLGMHLVSVLSTYKQLFNPYAPGNHLFWSAVPVLAAIIALFILRNEDRLLTLISCPDN
ncbi:MAG: DoxX protein [Okeania sp. SIO3H1]|nr:DoxX protein [Okeania sp. SIO3H1]NET27338.1 DoxX protein [Okeania sp. SIO1I7]